MRQVIAANAVEEGWR